MVVVGVARRQTYAPTKHRAVTSLATKYEQTRSFFFNSVLTTEQKYIAIARNLNGQSGVKKWVREARTEKAIDRKLRMCIAPEQKRGKF